MEPNDTDTASPVNTSDTSVSPATTPEVPGTPASVPSVKSDKKLFGKIGLIPAAVIGAAILIGGSAAAYFGLVVPNQPENIWKAALNNTAAGYDKFVDYGDKQKDTKGGSIKGTFKFDSPEMVIDGSIDGKFDKKNSNINLDAGAAGTRLKFNLLTNIPDGASMPDIYVKAEGLDGLAGLLGGGDPAAGEMLAGLNNQYYFIDHTLLEQYENQAIGGAASGVNDIKPEDVVDLLKQFGEVNKEYVFTTDESKAIFAVKEEVVKETVDGRDVFHFKVAVKKEQLKAWNQAVCDRLVDHKVVKALSTGTSDEDRKKECLDTSDIDSVDENKTADVWVDMKTKLIRTVRVTDDDNNHVDFGLLYDGGDEYPLYMTMKNQERGDTTVKVTLNTKTNSVALVVDAGIKSDGQESNIDATLTFQPSNEAVDFTKPEGAKSLSDLIAPFMGAGLTEPTSLEQDSSDDAFSFE